MIGCASQRTAGGGCPTRDEHISDVAVPFSERAATWGPYTERYAIARGAGDRPCERAPCFAARVFGGDRRSPYHAAPFRLVEGLGMGSRQYNVAVVGATGIVGAEFLKIVAERRFPL